MSPDQGSRSKIMNRFLDQAVGSPSQGKGDPTEAADRSRSECGYNRALILALDELLRLGAVQCGGQLLQRGAVLVVGTGHQQVGVGRGGFREQRVTLWIELGFQRVVGVDQRQVDLIQHARQGGGL